MQQALYWLIGLIDMVIYKPRSKIAIASSFEGIFNDGAPECGVVSYNSAIKMGYKLPFSNPLDPKDYTDYVRQEKFVRAFLLLRPLVEVAEDYLTVIQAIQENQDAVDFLLENLNNTRAYKPFLDSFSGLKTHADRAKFKTEFYAERERLKKTDYNGWLNLQSPFLDTVPQFRELANTMEVDPQSGEITTGFVPWLATSKDENSSHELCIVYSYSGKQEQADVSGQRCIIVRNRIIGKERTTDKVKQLEAIAKAEDLEPGMVWRLNDRYDIQQQEELASAGFVNQFLVPGYMFPHDIERARKDLRVRLLERNRFAEQLGEIARESGL